jgi:hypothetical protein
MTHPISYRRILGKLGYYNYQSGLIYRNLSQEDNWDSHIDHCRRFIIRALDIYKPEKVTVLGSGWLLELPLSEIAEKTERVSLVDIIHPPDVIDQTRKLKNVILTEEDLTGGLIAEVWQKAGKHFFFNRMKSLNDINIPLYKTDNDPGMVISLNILTQLESLLVEFIKKRSSVKQEELNHFRTGIQKNHIEFLKNHRSILITDIAEVFSDRKGETKTVPTLMTDLPASEINEEWTWDFDLKGTDNYNSRSVMKVVALTI